MPEVGDGELLEPNANGLPQIVGADDERQGGERDIDEVFEDILNGKISREVLERMVGEGSLKLPGLQQTGVEAGEANADRGEALLEGVGPAVEEEEIFEDEGSEITEVIKEAIAEVLAADPDTKKRVEEAARSGDFIQFSQEMTRAIQRMKGKDKESKGEKIGKGVMYLLMFVFQVLDGAVKFTVEAGQSGH